MLSTSCSLHWTKPSAGCGAGVLRIDSRGRGLRFDATRLSGELPMRSAAVTIGLLALGAMGLGAQAKDWVDPKPPCDIKPGFFRLNSAIVDLQQAARQPQM